jgi:F0F1-type ATP synthase membrane subunit b/b'
MNTNFFLTIIIAVIITAVFCYVGYVVTKRMILKFISSIKKAIEEIDTEPDETSSHVRYEMSDRAYNDMLIRELRKDSMQARTLARKPVNFRIVEDPGKIKSDEIIFMQ